MVRDPDLLKLTKGLTWLCLAQSLSGVWLYFLRYGLSPEKTAISWITWAKVTGPHLFAITLVTFALAHLLAFAEGTRLRFWASALILSGFAHTLSGALALWLGPQWAWVKLFTLLGFQTAFFIVSWVILKSVRLSQSA